MLIAITPSLPFTPSQNTRGTKLDDEKNKEDNEHPDMRLNLTN